MALYPCRSHYKILTHVIFAIENQEKSSDELGPFDRDSCCVTWRFRVFFTGSLSIVKLTLLLFSDLKAGDPKRRRFRNSDSRSRTWLSGDDGGTYLSNCSLLSLNWALLWGFLLYDRAARQTYSHKDLPVHDNMVIHPRQLPDYTLYLFKHYVITVSLNRTLLRQTPTD